MVNRTKLESKIERTAEAYFNLVELGADIELKKPLTNRAKLLYSLYYKNFGEHYTLRRNRDE